MLRYRLSNHSEVVYDFAAILDLIGNYAGYPVARRKIAGIRQTIARLKEYLTSALLIRRSCLD